ncbi:MAG: protein kinase domain-containing protein, partial [Planctomycetota bacterium]|jgi:tetratricopeptide (TPR) repeat protein
VLEVGEHEGNAWFAMELVEGEPLSKQIKEREFTWQEAVTIVRDVADALSVAHEKGVLHRDIKPSNILMDAEGKPHLTDFGLAKDTRTESKYTRTGQTLGTPAYMSPEQARGNLAQLAPASDVWALGCVLYELLANRPAFEGDTAAAVIGAVIAGARPRLDDTCPGVPRGVRAVLDGCLARVARHRPQHAAALVEDCDRVLAGSTPRHARAPRGPSRLLIPALAAVVLAVAAAAGISWWAGAPAARGAVEAAKPSARERAQAEAARVWAARASDPDVAIAALARLTDSAQLEPEWSVRLGLLQWSRNQIPAARRSWQAVPRESPAFTRAQLFLGVQSVWDRRGHQASPQDVQRALEEAALDPGDIGRAARAVQALTRPTPDVERALEALGDAAGWEAEAVRAYVEAVRLDGDVATALRHMDNVLASGITFAWVQINRGIVLLRVDVEAALAAFEAALELAPGDSTALGNRGLALARLNRFDEALAAADASLAADPSNYSSLFLRSMTLASLGRSREARDAYGDALRAARAATDAREVRAGERAILIGRIHSARSALLLSLKEHDAALADADAAIAIRSTDVRAHRTRFLALVALGRKPAAADAAGRLVGAAGDNPEHMLQAASTLLTWKHYALGVRCCDRVIAAGYRPAYARLLRGSGRYSLGRHEGALEDFAEVIRRDGGEMGQDAQRFRSELLYSLGRTQEAFDEIGRLIARSPADLRARGLRLQWGTRELARPALEAAATERRRELLAWRIEDLKVVLPTRPDDDLGWSALIEAHGALGDHEAALAAASEFKRRRPKGTLSAEAAKALDTARDRLAAERDR